MKSKTKTKKTKKEQKKTPREKQQKYLIYGGYTVSNIQRLRQVININKAPVKARRA